MFSVFAFASHLTNTILHLLQISCRMTQQRKVDVDAQSYEPPTKFQKFVQ